MDAGFMGKVSFLREKINRPFIVRSAFRCPEYNAKVSDTGRTGPHTHGRAIDIECDSRLRFLIAYEATQLGITRIGVGKTFIHIDDLTEEDSFPEMVMWGYGK